MSRVGTPTDTPIIEEVNGWVKGELYIYVKIHKQPNLHDTINTYIEYFNNLHPAYVNHYKPPSNIN